LVIFIDSTKENLLDLHYAKEEFDIEQISNIAHKMLPMFKQLEIKTLINTLEVLEDKSISFDTQEDLNKYIDELEINVNKVLDQIKLNHFE